MSDDVKYGDMRTEYGKSLVELGEQDKNVIVLGADTTDSLKTADFGKKFPERFFNVGIAEANLVSVAAGLAYSGKTSFASTYAIFLPGRCVDQIRNAIAYPSRGDKKGLNVKLVVSHGGLSVGADGGSHQQLEDIAIMRAMPNMRVLIPADSIAVSKLTWTIAQQYGPFYMRMARSKVPTIHTNSQEFRIGKGITLKKDEAIEWTDTWTMKSDYPNPAHGRNQEYPTNWNTTVWDKKNMNLVAFVQNKTTKEVMQAEMISRRTMPTSQAPVLSAISDVTIDEDKTTDVTLSATDPDNDPITYSATSDTNAVTASISSSKLTLTPNANWNGLSNITVYASDGVAKDTVSFKLTVTPIPDPPSAFAWTDPTSEYDSIGVTNSNGGIKLIMAWGKSLVPMAILLPIS